MAKVYFALVPNGGGFGAMDKIDGSILADQDMCYVLDHAGERFYPYTLDATLGGTASPPDTVQPLTNAGTKRWVLVNTQAAQWSGMRTFLQAANIGAALTGIELAVDHFWFPAAGMKIPSTNGATRGENEYATNDLMKDYLVFPSTVEKFADFHLVMPSAWDRSTVKFKAYWSSASGSSVADTCEWKLRGVAVGDDDAIDAALGTQQVISDAITAADGDDLQISAANATPLTIAGNPALGDLVHFKISRNVSGSDNMTEDAWLFGIMVQISYSNGVSAW